MTTTTLKHDQRFLRTRAAIIGAFNGLVLSQRYDDISVAEIIARAGVGRSTFYEHFRNKDEVLKVAVTHVLIGFADAVREFAKEVDATTNVKHIQMLLDHFRENQRRARALLEGPSASAVTQVLADLVAERLPAATRLLPRSLATMHIAEAQLGLVRAWLGDLGSCTSATLARAIHDSTRSLVAPLLTNR